MQSHVRKIVKTIIMHANEPCDIAGTGSAGENLASSDDEISGDISSISCECVGSGGENWEENSCDWSREAWDESGCSGTSTGDALSVADPRTPSTSAAGNTSHVHAHYVNANVHLHESYTQTCKYMNTKLQ